MTCPTSPIAADAAARLPRLGSAPRLAIPTAVASGPVGTIVPQPSNGTAKHISSRALKLRHPNAVQRQRYREKHLTLASRIYSGGDA